MSELKTPPPPQLNEKTTTLGFNEPAACITVWKSFRHILCEHGVLSVSASHLAHNTHKTSKSRLPMKKVWVT